MVTLPGAGCTFMILQNLSFKSLFWYSSSASKRKVTLRSSGLGEGGTFVDILKVGEHFFEIMVG